MKVIILPLALLCGVPTANAENYVPADTVRVNQLDEVVIEGEKPQVKGQDGMMVVDLPMIVKDKPVTNVLEALGYLPGVVNNNGQIGLAGAASVTIILNGELTNMPVQNLYQLLYSTPVDRLANVEVMYSAPAKYHVDGAVINVVLKTPSVLDGLQGQARVGYNQSHYGAYGGGLAATYAVKDWTFDLNYSLSRTKSWAHEETFSNHLFEGSRLMIEDDNRRTGENWSNLIYASVAWKSLKLTYNGQITSDVHSWSESTGTLGYFMNANNYTSPINFHNVSLRYEAPSDIILGADYTRYSEERSQAMFEGRDLEYIFSSTNNQSINRLHVYSDCFHQFDKWQLSYGVEYQHSEDNSQQHFYPYTQSFSNVMKEDVVNYYIGVQASFDWGLSFNASLKGEYFKNAYQEDWNFIPQLGVTYYKTPKSIFQLNFNSQRIYPSYWELHGGTSYLNSYAMVMNNPALQPYINYSGQLSYILNQKYVATLYASYDDKYFVQLPYQSPDELKLIYQTLNMDYKRIVGLNLHVPVRVGNLWNATVTANVFNQREKTGRFHDISFDNEKWIFYGALNNTIKFSQNCPVSLSLDFSYISPSMQGIADLTSMWKIDAGVKWQFGKKRTCELNLKADDIFNAWSPTMTISHAGQDYRMKVRDMTRNLKLTFTWRFNGFKPKETTIDTSRFGTGK